MIKINVSVIPLSSAVLQVWGLSLVTAVFCSSYCICIKYKPDTRYV